MPIFFKNATINEPFIFDSIGNRWEQERITRPKGYPHYHYLQTESGCGRILIGTKEYFLHSGEGILIAPFTGHNYQRYGDFWTTSFATFTGTIEDSLDRVFGGKKVVLIPEVQTRLIGSLIDEIVKKYENPPHDYKVLSIDCYTLMMNLLDVGYSRSEMLTDPLFLSYLAPVLKDIETNYDRELTVRALSEKVFVTPQYLSRLFSRFLGCSVYQYLTSYRINKAKVLLTTHPRMEIREVARRVGFTDTSHFIAMFKKVTGYTPLSFKKLY